MSQENPGVRISKIRIENYKAIDQLELPVLSLVHAPAQPDAR